MKKKKNTTLPKKTSKIHSNDCRNGNKIDTLNTQINGRSPSWLGASTSMKTGRIKLALCPQTPPSLLNYVTMHISIFILCYNVMRNIS